MKKLYVLGLLSTLLACSADKAADVGPGSATGRGGSMARFTVAGEHLYIVNHSDLQVYTVRRSDDPRPVDKIPLQFGVETIFPFNRHLLIGTQTGMYIFGLANPARPELLSVYNHVMSCDPVVAQGNYAYVTLRSGTPCRNGINLLDVLDISNMRQPRLVNRYTMQSPHGLGIDGALLFVGEGDNGLTVFDASDPASPKRLQTFREIRTYDVIPHQNVLIVTGKDGIQQYRYGGEAGLQLLSKLPVE